MVLQEVSGAARSKGWLGAFAPIGLGALGMAVSGGSLSWGFYADRSAVLDPQAVIWVGGLSGVAMMAFGAYLALRRLGGPDES